ncbi:MarR family transcriptional regulator [Allochromatium humboldtianum]|uniref:MarR family transcriptional regulator n=1 Tax=Allochromatium humboldtianum TaxID=504901 RepID=A0A850RIF8_9GAMM|nr:MarR family transcriptional regulator [Allochromatium humboldtianum]
MSAAQPQNLTATILSVFRANGQLLDWGDRFVAPYDLTSARWQMLGALKIAAQPQTTPQIAASMGVSRQGAQKQLNLLVEAGLIEKRPNPAHLRSPLYQLTDTGHALYQQVDKRWRAHADALSAQFSDEQLATARWVLDTICQLHSLSSEGEQHEN